MELQEEILGQMRQLELFSPQRLANRPYCMRDKGAGMYIRSLKDALGQRYIQANAPSLVFRLVFDLDYDVRATAHMRAWAQDIGAPEPNWTAINPDSGRAHVAYEIEVPVARHDAARSGPIRLAAAIEDALTIQLRADTGYVGLICKNPLHPGWSLVPGRQAPYDLAELCDWVDLKPYSGRKPKQPGGSIGRNITLFDRLRAWAYREVRHYRGGRREAWDAAVLSQAESLNCFVGDDLPQTRPLALAEVKAVARSVAKYCWHVIGTEESNKRFSQRQAARGKRGGFASGAARFNASMNQRLEAQKLRDAGQSVPSIAQQFGVSSRTVQRWLNQD